MNDATNVNNNSGEQGGGANPPGNENNNGAQNNQNNQGNQNTATFDPSKVSDEDFAKVFDDPRTFQHSRFKELTDAQKELQKIKADQAKAEEERLKEQGKHQELADAKAKEAETLRAELVTTRIDTSLLMEANKLGIVDPDAALKLVDRSGITHDDTTKAVSGAKEALEALLKDKPYLAGKGTTRIGSPSNPTGQNTGELKRFKHSEIQDPEFYRKNEKDILASLKAGLIENDL
jgi:hypothetical protein